MSDWSQTIENLKIIGESVQQQVDLINKSMRPVFEAVAKIQEVSNKLAKIFSRTIYVTPEVYDFLLSQNVQISPEEIEKRKVEETLSESEIYTVYTRDVGKVKVVSFDVTADMAKAIKKIIANSPQFMSMETEKIIFEDGEYPSLTINGVKIGLKNGSVRYYLCEYIFNGEKVRKMPWDIVDLVEARHEDFFSTNRNWNEIMYGQFRRFNEDIKNMVGYKDFFIVQNRRFLINPRYVFLLEK